MNSKEWKQYNINLAYYLDMKKYPHKEFWPTGLVMLFAYENVHLFWKHHVIVCIYCASLLIFNLILENQWELNFTLSPGYETAHTGQFCSIPY